MRALLAAFNWMRQLFSKRRFEREMRAEMEAHIEQQADLNRARGMTASESMEAARRDFGNVAHLQEQARDARGTRFIEETKRDLQYGVRGLLRTPGFTLVALLSLTLGIGVNTAMFTFLHFVFAPVSVINPATYAALSYPITYPAWKLIDGERNLFSSTVVTSNVSVAIARAGESAMPVQAQLVSDGFFRMYAIRPLLGRVLVEGEADNTEGVPALVLSHPFWSRAFGADSGVIGRVVRLSNGSSFTVVGVADAGTVGAHKLVPDFWIPLSARLQLPSYRSADSPVDWLNDPSRRWLTMGARLSEGTSVDMARARLRSLLSHLNSDDTTIVETLDRTFAGGEAGSVSAKNAAGVGLVLSATLMVLLIGCANVANLVLARGVRRRREIAVRMSLGASRLRLVRQLMAESAILAIGGGALALALSAVVIRLVLASRWFQEVLHNEDGNLIARLQQDTSTVVFTFAVAFVSAAACGLLPALRSTRMDLSSATKDDGAAPGNRLTRSKLRTGLVVGQVALCLVLLISASVLVRSARNAMSMDLGFDREHLVTTTVSLQQSGYNASQQHEFEHNYEERVSTLVGAINVARGSVPILSDDVNYVRVNPTESPRKTAAILTASPNYFAVLGIQLTRGRNFTALEAHNASPVVVVSEATAKRLWPGVDPIGQRLTYAGERYGSGVDSLVNVREVTVVGVASDAQVTSVGYTPQSLIYAPADTGGNLLVRAENPGERVAVLRDAARISDPNVVMAVRTMDEIISKVARIQGAGITAGYAGALGVLALGLSLLGIFGVVSYAVSQRTREIGVRLAIGAQQTDVLSMVIRQGMRPVLYGVASGVFMAVLTTRALRVFMFGISSVDPVAYAVAATSVCVAALLACYLPARRATRIDPVGALRAE